MIDLSTPCIQSINKPNPTHGYALRVIDGRRQYEHRAAWEAVNGAVPEGLVLDHLCHDPSICHLASKCPHRACRNPLHLAPTTRGENIARGYNRNRGKTHCEKGHEFTEENTYVSAKGSRICRKCRDRHVREWKIAHRGR